MARPAQWPFAETTLEDVLSSAPGSKLQQQGSGSSLADAARSARATVQQAAVHHVDSVPTWGRGSAVAYCVGLVAIAATVTVMVLSVAPSAQAATRPTAVTDDQGTMVQPTKLNPALPFAEQENGMRLAPRPALRNHGSLTAALQGGDARTSAAAKAANPFAAMPADETKFVPGFAKPGNVGKSLGRLAEDLPAVLAKTKLTRYAALGKPGRSNKQSTSSSRLSGNISTGGKSTSCLPSDLKRVLNEAAAKFGHLRINSTLRSHSHNRRVGGAPRSLHLECRAVDFAYHGPRRGALIKFLRNHGDVGGVGVYGGSGHIHIDDGPRRSW